MSHQIPCTVFHHFGPALAAPEREQCIVRNVGRSMAEETALAPKLCVPAFKRVCSEQRETRIQLRGDRYALEEGGNQTFKLGPEAVALKLVDALESRNPKPRYYVTIPTYAATLFRRLLPTRALDAIAARN